MVRGAGSRRPFSDAPDQWPDQSTEMSYVAPPFENPDRSCVVRVVAVAAAAAALDPNFEGLCVHTGGRFGVPCSCVIFFRSTAAVITLYFRI